MKGGQSGPPRRFRNPSVQPVSLTSGWLRYSSVYETVAQSAGMITGLELKANSQLDVYGFQLEPAGTFTSYKQTREAAGVQQKSRFDLDELRWVANGLSNNATTLMVVAI